MDGPTAWVDGASGGPRINLGAGVALDPGLVVHAAVPGAEVVATVDVVTGGRVGITSMTITATDGGAIDSDALRAVPLRPIFENALLNAMHWDPDGRGVLDPIPYVLQRIAASIPQGATRIPLPTGDTARAVSAIIHAARLTGVGPQSLLIELGLSRSTANYWVSVLGKEGSHAKA